MKHPFIAALLTTVTIVAITVTATVVGWPRIFGAASDEQIAAERPAAPVTAPVTSVRYVALGSSYAAGPDSSDLVSTRCMRTADDYPHQVARALSLSLHDVTCSGSTIPDILDRAQPGRADLPQIDAVTADTDLVTVTTGGNDVSYIGRLTALSCANSSSALSHTEAGIRHRCHPTRPGPPESPADFTALERRMVGVVTAVRARAPHAVVVIVSYPPVLDDRGSTCASVPLTPAQAQSTVATFRGLTDATRAAAVVSGAILVDATAAGAGHTTCSASPWVYGYREPAPYHPNAAGRAEMARLTVDAVATAGLTPATAPR